MNIKINFFLKKKKMTELFFLILQFFIIYFLLSFHLFAVFKKSPVLNNFSFSEKISFFSIKASAALPNGVYLTLSETPHPIEKVDIIMLAEELLKYCK